MNFRKTAGRCDPVSGDALRKVRDNGRRLTAVELKLGRRLPADHGDLGWAYDGRKGAIEDGVG